MPKYVKTALSFASPMFKLEAVKTITSPNLKLFSCIISAKFSVVIDKRKLSVSVQYSRFRVSTNPGRIPFPLGKSYLLCRRGQNVDTLRRLKINNKTYFTLTYNQHKMPGNYSEFNHSFLLCYTIFLSNKLLYNTSCRPSPLIFQFFTSFILSLNLEGNKNGFLLSLLCNCDCQTRLEQEQKSS